MAWLRSWTGYCGAMGFLDKVGSFVKREVKDLGEVAKSAKDKFDQGLAKREQELKMTPSEKIASLQQQAATTDATLDAIADRATDRNEVADAVDEVGDIDSDDDLPSVTHIVLPDGRVGSDGEVAEHVVDEQVNVHEVPPVEAPFADGLNKFPPPEGAAVDALPAPPDAVSTGADAEQVEARQDAAAPDALLEDMQAKLAAATPPSVDEGDPAVPTYKPDETNHAEFDDTDEAAAPVATTVADTAEQLLPPPPDVSDVVDEVLPPPATGAAPDFDPDQPVDSNAEAANLAPSPEAPSPDYGKTPAQLKYERARAAANDLLDELRGELKAGGEI